MHLTHAGWSMRAPNRSSRSHRGLELTVSHYEYSADQNICDSVGIICRLFKRRLVNDRRRIEHRQIRVCTNSQSAFVLHHGGDLLQSLGGHQSHLANCIYQRERLQITDVMTEYAGISPGAARMALAV